MLLDKKQRRCLSCQKFFNSSHKGHRICPNCSAIHKQMKGLVRKPYREDI